MSEHEHWDELAAGYALDALEPEEHAEFVTHVDGCAHCREAVDRHTLVAAQLGSLAGDDIEMTPPAWSAIRPGVVGGEPATAPEADIVVLLQRRRWVAVTAAAAVVAALVGVITWRAGHGGNDVQPLASVAACRQTDGCHVVALNAGDSSPANVLVYGDDLRLVSTSMPAPPKGRVWALWQVPRDGAPRLLSEFGSGSPRARLAVTYDDTSDFALSQERAGVTPAAPTTVVAHGPAT